MQTPSISPALLGFLRALGVAFVIFILSYLGDAAHLSGLVSDSTAAVIAALALALEHNIEVKSGSALFGAIKTR